MTNKRFVAGSLAGILAAGGLAFAPVALAVPQIESEQDVTMGQPGGDLAEPGVLEDQTVEGSFDPSIAEDQPADAPLASDTEALSDDAPVADAPSDEGQDSKGLKTIEEYNELLKQYRDAHSDMSLTQLAKDPAYQTILLSRYLVNKAGYDAIAKTAKEDENFATMLEWLFSDVEMLGYMTNNGAPEGNEFGNTYNLPTAHHWNKALEVLSKIYAKHSEDVTEESAGEQAGLNKRMMAATALTHSINVRQFTELSQADHLFNWIKWDHWSEPVGRYEVFKRLYEKGMLTQEFATQNMAELRMVFNTPLDNNELQWANWYYHVKIWGDTDYETDPNKFGYTQPKYSLPRAFGGMFPYGAFDHYPNGPSKGKYYAPENYDMWNKKWHFEQYDDVYDFKVDYGYKDGNKDIWYSPLWMTLETDGVCWDISFTSWAGFGSLGIPSSYIYQPGHQSFVQYYIDTQGRAIWGSGYDNYGMKQSGRKKGGPTYLPAGWSDYTWTNFYNMTYGIIGMDAMRNRFDTDFETAQYLAFTGDYLLETGDAEGALEAYNEALDVQYMNLTAWDGVIRAYKALDVDNTTWMKLVDRIGKTLAVYPLPVHDMIYNLILPEVSDDPLLHYELLCKLDEHLAYARSIAVNGSVEVSQPGSNREQIDYLRNSVMPKPASFSFNARSLSLEKSFAESGGTFEYSFDNGNTWHEWARSAGDASLEFSQDQINQITADNDVLYRMKGSKYIKRIDITSQGAPVSNSKTNTLNDDEDVFLNVQGGIEYSTDQGVTWKSLNSNVMFEGDVEVWIRWGYAATKLAGEPLKLQFTKGEGTAERSYVKARNGKIVVESAPESMKNSSNDNLIDGRPETEWEVQYTTAGLKQDPSGAWVTNHEHEFVFKFEKPTYVSAMEYDPAKGRLSGAIQACELYTSMDGKTWEKAGSVDGWAQNGDRKKIDLDIPSYASYVKVKTTKVGTYNFMGRNCGYVTVGDFRFFENYHVRSTEIQLESLDFDATGARTDYKVGDRIDFTNVNTIAHFSDDSTARIPAQAYEWNADVLDSVGKKTLKGTYQGHTVSFDINVSENDRNATKIESVKAEARTYYAGEDVPKDALEVKVTDGNESWYLLHDEYTLDKKLAEGMHDYTVTMNSTNLTSKVKITAEAGVSALAAAGGEGFTGNFVLGDEFDPKDFVVTLTRADGTEETLPVDRYTAQMIVKKEENGEMVEKIEPIDSFGATPGSKKVRFTLKDHTLTADVDITVLPYIEVGPFIFEANEDGTACTLTGFTPESGYGSEIVKIPASVEQGGKTYPVTEIGSGAFASASGLTSVQIPASVKNVASGAFSSCPNLTRVYMTEFKTLDGFKCGDGAFPKVEDGLVFLRSELAGSESPIPGYTVADVMHNARGIEIVPPARLHYALGEELDQTGLEVYAILEDGTKVAAVSYDVAGYDKDIAGTQTVTVSLRNTHLSKTFDVEVKFPDVIIEEQPVGGAYNSVEAIKPLEVKAAAGLVDPSYQWYFAQEENEVSNPIEGATESSYKPTRAGWYLAEVFVQDKNSQTGEKVQTKTVRIDVNEGFVAAIGETGYTSVLDAVNSTSGDIVIDMLCDSIAPDEVAIVGRAVTINGNGYELKRGTFANSMFNLVDYNKKQSLTLNNVKLDGSAVWTGEVDATLGRGTVNTGRKDSSALVTVKGPGSALVLAEGTELRNNDATRQKAIEGGSAVFLMHGASFRATNASIRNCSTNAHGGAIWAKYRNGNSGVIPVTLDNVEITGCSAGGDGGGVYVSEYTELTLTNSRLANNKSNAHGGALMFESFANNGGDPDISGVAFEGNTAKNGGAVTAVRRISMTDVSFLNNRATQNGGAVFAKEFKNAGGNIINGGGAVTIAGKSVISGNSAVSGGGIYAQAATLTGTEMEGNSAQADGGAIYTSGKTDLKEGNAISNSSAGASGGGVYAGALNTFQTTFEGNRASGNGGAAYASSVIVELDTFTGNNASDGGAIYAAGSLGINGSSFADNNAEGKGDAACLNGNGALKVMFLKEMQDVYISSIGTMTIEFNMSGQGLPLVTDADIADDAVIGQCYGGDVSGVTINGGKVKLKGADLMLADNWHDLGQYRTGDKLAAPEQEGKVFAGWYTTDDPKQMNGSTAIARDMTEGRVAYAKFVDEAVLTTKFQTSAGVEKDADKTDLRMLSSVDSLMYRGVGFKYRINDGEVQRRQTSTVFPTVNAAISGGVDRIKPGDIFGGSSTRFIAWELRDIPQSAFGDTLTVTPFWVTFDGTEVNGKTREMKVGEIVGASADMYRGGVSHAQE